MNTKYETYTITQLSELIKTKKLSPIELTKYCLELIKVAQPKINAFITVLEDEALEQAKHAEAEIAKGEWRGELHGIPVAFKDMYDTAGIKTTAAFEHFAHRVPQKDADAVSKIKEAGAIIIGKTNMHTLAMGTTSVDSFFGAVKNPWNTDYIAGGSSGGSAAAIAAGLCFATIDTDAIGSVRLPAACCGVVGYKCTWGLLDNSGILADQPADPSILKLATVGITARSAADAAIVAAALNKNFDFNITNLPKTLGVVKNFGADDETRQNFNKSLAVLKDLGYKLIDVEAPFAKEPDMAKIDEYRKNASQDVFKNIDVIVLPTLATVVPKITDVGSDPQALSPQNTFFANYLGLPAISVPNGYDRNGLPTGLQFVGRQNFDSEVLAASQAYQQATPEFQKLPSYLTN